MTEWIVRDNGNDMPASLHADDRVEVRFRNGNTFTRDAGSCDWSQTPMLAGDIIEYRVIDSADPIAIVREHAGPMRYMPMDARNAYIVGPLALYVHEAPVDELRSAMADLQRYLEVFIDATTA